MRCCLCPRRVPLDLFETEKNLFETEKKRNNIKLYERRVFIRDDCDELIPEFVRFSLEYLERRLCKQNKILRVIKKSLVKNYLEMLAETANGE